MASYPSQHEEAQQQKQKRNEPSPLRIVKRHRSSESGNDAEESTYASAGDSDSDISNIIDGTQRLQIFKRRSRPCGLARGEFGTSLAELNKAHRKPWGDAIASCRGLLRKSTPDIRSYKRFLSFGQTSSSRTASTSRISSWDSSRQRSSTDGHHLPSVSSDELDFTSVQVSNDPQHWTSDFRHSRQMRKDSPHQLSPRQISRNTGGYILSPRIVVTAQKEEIVGKNASVWAAVEISRKLSQTSPATTSTEEEETHGDKPSGTFVDHKLDRFFDFGCLYDLTVEVHSANEADIVEVIQEQSWPTTIYAGTSILLVVHLRLDSTDRGGWGHSRCRSEELMEELELQLGDIQTRLMSIKISYLHSAFPKIDDAHLAEDGLCHLESRLETTATAALVRNSSDSVWSSRTRASQNSLFPLMVQHWGDEKAIDVQRRISDAQMVCRNQGTRSQYSTDPIMANCSTAMRSHSTTTRLTCPNYQLEFGRHHGESDASQMAAESRWKAWSGQELSRPQCLDEGIKTPVREMYYFGERAIKALRPPTGLESGGTRRNLSSNKRAAVLGSKEKDSKFWDWGKWF